MTREDIICKAKQEDEIELIEFIKLAILQEREACAKVCDEYDVAEDVNTCDTAEGIALAIRARGAT